MHGIVTDFAIQLAEIRLSYKTRRRMDNDHNHQNRRTRLQSCLLALWLAYGQREGQAHRGRIALEGRRPRPRDQWAQRPLDCPRIGELHVRGGGRTMSVSTFWKFLNFKHKGISEEDFIVISIIWYIELCAIFSIDLYEYGFFQIFESTMLLGNVLLIMCVIFLMTIITASAVFILFVILLLIITALYDRIIELKNNFKLYLNEYREFRDSMEDKE